MKPPGQLIENKVRVEFCRADLSHSHTRTYDLCVDDQRREMGRSCALWQSDQVGNTVRSEVLTIVRR